MKLNHGRFLFSLDKIFCLLVSVCVLKGCPAELISMILCHPFKLVFQTGVLGVHENRWKSHRKVARGHAVWLSGTCCISLQAATALGTVL